MNNQSESQFNFNVPKEINDQIFNCKSVAIYDKWHCMFISYLEDNNLPETLESILLFMKNISSKYASSTLWQAYSCLNKYYSTYKSWRSFNETPILKNFLKKIEKDSLKKNNLPF